MVKKKVTIGERFGRWEIVQDLGIVGKRGLCVKVKCDCGKERSHYYSVLCAGLSTSCGCYRKENAAVLISKREHKHNLSKHPLYAVWIAMKDRCYNRKDKQYKDYGGRGIIVCNEWNNSFKVFYNWCIDNGYSKGLQIDRKNNDLNYTPTNCRFVLPIINMRNRRNNNNIEYNGEVKCITDWAKELNMSVTGLFRRIKSWGVDRAFNTKLQIKNKI